MKKITPLVIISFFVVSNLLSQIRDELNYYPLQVGDMWQYKINYQPESGKDTTFYMLRTVLADTLLSNGRKYFIVEQPPFTYYEIKNLERVLIRIDSTSGVVYKFISELTPEEKIDSLFCMNKPFFNNKFICSDTSYSAVFSNLLLTKTISSPASSNYSFYWREAMGIGIYYQENWRAIVTAEGNKYDLVYAKINGREYGTLVDVNEQEIIPDKYSLSQNYPNPFNPTTTIKYSIPFVKTLHATSLQHVTLKVFDILGNEIVTLVNEEKFPGKYEVTFNGSNLASGVYLYRLTTKDFSINKKMILMK